MNLSFVTSNRHKYEEVKSILSAFGIETEWVNEEYNEPGGDVDFVAGESSRILAERLGKPVCVDDTGVYFEAYPGFPGPHPKFVFDRIGYEGIMRLLDGKSRKAYFRTAVGYCEPGKKPVVFEGVMNCTIAGQVFDEDKDVMPYERIFIPEGKKGPLSSLSRDEKNRISHRYEAFRRLGEFLNKKK